MSTPNSHGFYPLMLETVERTLPIEDDASLRVDMNICVYLIKTNTSEIVISYAMSSFTVQERNRARRWMYIQQENLGSPRITDLLLATDDNNHLLTPTLSACMDTAGTSKIYSCTRMTLVWMKGGLKAIVQLNGENVIASMLIVIYVDADGDFSVLTLSGSIYQVKANKMENIHATPILDRETWYWIPLERATTVDLRS
jgi:hypothetical protein